MYQRVCFVSDPDHLITSVYGNIDVSVNDMFHCFELFFKTIEGFFLVILLILTHQYKYPIILEYKLFK